MKRILLFATVAGAALASCVKNESEGGMTASDSKISFEAPVVGTTTRAQVGEIGDVYPTEESFKVWGWYHERDYTTFEDQDNGWKNYMTDTDGNPVVVEYDGRSSWDSETDYYWPKTGKLTFAAYSPADAVGTYTHPDEGLQIAGFTVAAVGGAQYDLMYSDRAYNRTSSTDQYTGTASHDYDGVDIVFHHALSSIVFKVGTDTDYTNADNTFKIKNITIKNVYGAGNFNEGLTDGTTTRTPAWTATGNADNSYEAFSGDFTVPNDGTTFEEPVDTSTDPDAEPTDLILLPQSLNSDTPVIEIVYTYGTEASGEIQHTVEYKLNQTDDKEWKPNKRYTYNIIFGLNKIYFEPIVEAWEDVEVTTDFEI